MYEQRYLMVNLDKHSMNKITLTSKKKSKNRRQERPLWLQGVRERMSKTTKIS